MDLSRFRNSGDLFLPVWMRRILDIYLIGNDKTLFYVNIWSLIHAISGTLTLLILLTYTQWSIQTMSIAAFGIHTIWELWQLLITNTPRTSRGVIDILTDTVFYMAGFIVPMWLLATG
jgi:hypothetical protein